MMRQEYQPLSRDCCGMPVQRGCFIFAVINIIIVGVSVLGCAGMLAVVLIGYHEQGFSSHVYVFTILTAGCCVGTVIALIFGVLLLVGLSQKKPQYVMAYLVYGVVAEAASVGGILAFIVMQWEEWALVGYSCIFLVVCVIYPFLLWLVYQTYAVLVRQPQKNSHLFGKLPHHECEC